jgi:hypothetical protein
VEAGVVVGVEVDDVRIDDPDERPDHLTRGDAHVLVLLRRLPHHAGRIERRTAPRHPPDVKDRKLGGL